MKVPFRLFGFKLASGSVWKTPIIHIHCRGTWKRHKFAQEPKRDGNDNLLYMDPWSQVNAQKDVKPLGWSDWVKQISEYQVSRYYSISGMHMVEAIASGSASHAYDHGMDCSSRQMSSHGFSVGQSWRLLHGKLFLILLVPIDTLSGLLVPTKSGTGMNRFLLT